MWAWFCYFLEHFGSERPTFLQNTICITENICYNNGRQNEPREVEGVIVYKTSDLIEQGKKIHVFRSECRQRPEELHEHEFIEIVYITHGKCRQEIDGVGYDAEQGDLFFINYGSMHAFCSEEAFGYVNVCFSPEVMVDGLITKENAFSLLSLTAFNEICGNAENPKISFEGDERRQIEEILSAMHEECRTKGMAWGRVVESYFNVLIAKMLRKTQAGIRTEEMGDVWKELSSYIDANLEGDLTLEALASKCFYNPSYFSRVFKEKYRMSLVEYVNRKRLERAIELLRQTTLPIDEISARVGYSGRGHFYHAFSKYIGGQPSDYRGG